MRPEDLKNIPDEELIKAYELYQETQRTIERWNVTIFPFLKSDKAENLELLLSCFNDKSSFAALCLTLSDEDEKFRILRFPSRKTLEAEGKRQEVYKYGKSRKAYKMTWKEIAEMCGVNSVTEARKYYKQAEEREKANRDEAYQNEKAQRFMKRISKFLIWTTKIEDGYI